MNLIVLIALLVTIATALPQGPPPTLLAGKVKPDFSCSTGVFGPTPETAAAIGECKTETAANPKCEYFCVAKYLGLLEPSTGLPTRESYTRFTKFNFPESLHEKATTHFNNCVDKFGSKIDLKDATCEQAQLFNDCTWEVQPELKC